MNSAYPFSTCASKHPTSRQFNVRRIFVNVRADPAKRAARGRKRCASGKCYAQHRTSRNKRFFLSFRAFCPATCARQKMSVLSPVASCTRKGQVSYLESKLVVCRPINKMLQMTHIIVKKNTTTEAASSSLKRAQLWLQIILEAFYITVTWDPRSPHELFCVDGTGECWCWTDFFESVVQDSTPSSKSAWITSTRGSSGLKKLRICCNLGCKD